uniref:Uncharacterized protein n=1 Tax=viral metagenome TaxID=1070528 RepID=A0A6C0H778_9ZZZZ
MHNLFIINDIYILYKKNIKTKKYEQIIYKYNTILL